MANDQNAILSLEKECFYFFDGNKVSKFTFTPQIVSDLDIVSEELLIKSIFQFIDTEKLNPTKFMFVISESALFLTDYKEKDPVKIDSEFNNFNSIVPYSRVLSKKYQIQDGVRMIATNEDLVEIICDAFRQKGFVRTEVVPSMIFGQIGIKKGLTVEDANYIIKNQVLSKGKSMLDPVPILQQPVTEVFKVTKGKSTMLPMLLGVMGLMVLVLVLLLVFRK